MVKSSVEKEIDEFVKELKAKTTEIIEFDKIADIMGKVGLKVEELRKSRDNWREKYEKLRK